MEIGFSKKKSTKAQKNVRNDEIFEFPALLEGKMIKKNGKIHLFEILMVNGEYCQFLKFLCFKIFDF